MSQKSNLFNSVQVSAPGLNSFDLSHDFKFSMNMGNLVPVACVEVVPGDRFRIGAEALFRFAPLVAPVMHRFNATIHTFFVANRLVWKGWEDWVTNGGTYPGDLPAYPTIVIDAAAYANGLPDYFGIPTPIGANTETISAIPFAAYQMIYDEYYRDQNVITPIREDLSGNTGSEYLISGDNTINAADLLTIRKRAWTHDYFTAALPFAQRGNAVNLPLGTVELNPDWAADGQHPNFATALNTPLLTGNIQAQNVSGGSITSSTWTPGELAYNPDGSLEVAPTTINDLRRAFKLQEWLEKSARGGNRYTELIRSFFGVISSDRRLQRPEYITGVKTPVQISEVLNTTGTEDLPQGNMAGHGIGVINSKSGYYKAEEHGYIISIMSILPETAYQQGIPRHFLKTSDPFQIYWPQFAHIGEQEVQNRELYAFNATSEIGDGTFGYVPRYAEYKFEPNRVAGEFRSTLNHWHAGRIFSALPALNKAFIEADPTHRIFAVTDETEDKIYCHVYNQVRALRPMPKFGTPTF